jgi:hypothetical protein
VTFISTVKDTEGLDDDVKQIFEEIVNRYNPERNDRNGNHQVYTFSGIKRWATPDIAEVC